MMVVTGLAILTCFLGVTHAEPARNVQITQAPVRAPQTEVAVVKAPLPLCNNVELELVPTRSGINVLLDPAGLVCIMADVFTGGLFTNFIERGFFNGEILPRKFPYFSPNSNAVPQSEPTPQSVEGQDTNPHKTTEQSGAPNLVGDGEQSEEPHQPPSPPTTEPAQTASQHSPSVEALSDGIPSSHTPEDSTGESNAALDSEQTPNSDTATPVDSARRLEDTTRETNLNIVRFKKLDLGSLLSFFRNISANAEELGWTPVTRMYMNAVLGTDASTGPGPLAEVITSRLSRVQQLDDDNDILNAVFATGSDLSEFEIYRLMQERIARLKVMQSGSLMKNLTAGALIPGRLDGLDKATEVARTSAIGLQSLPSDIAGAEAMLRHGAEQAANLIAPAKGGVLGTMEGLNEQIRDRLRTNDYYEQDPDLPSLPSSRMVRR